MANGRVSTEPHLRPEVAKVNNGWVSEWLGEVLKQVCVFHSPFQDYIPLVAAENPTEICTGVTERPGSHHEWAAKLGNNWQLTIS